jgi:hypothetical protein
MASVAGKPTSATETDRDIGRNLTKTEQLVKGIILTLPYT